MTRRPTALVYRARTASGRRIEVGADTDAEAPGHFSFTDPDPMVELTVRIPRGTERIVYPPAGTGGAALDPLEPATVGVLPTPTQIPDRVPDLPRSAQVGHPTATSSRPPGATANFVEPIPAGTRRYKVFLADAKELGEYHVMYAPDDETLMARFNSRGRHGVPVPTYIADITVPGARRHVYPPRG